MIVHDSNEAIAPTILTDSLPVMEMGNSEMYYCELKALGTSPITWSIVGDSAPSWLYIYRNRTQSYGGIYGYTEEDTKPGTYTFTVKAENSAGSDTKTYTLKVIEGEDYSPSRQKHCPKESRVYRTASS